MKALILDAGNSRIKLMAWAGDHQGPTSGPEVPPLLDLVARWDTPDRQGNLGPVAEAIRAAVGTAGGLPMVVSSVVPRVVEALAGCGQDIRVVDHRVEMPFDCAVEDRSAVGADRYCNVAAAFGAGLRNALVVDVGTATTFDLLLDGVFAGGLIAPGPEFALRCLGDRAARLAPVPFGPAPLTVGTNTADAMARGGWNTGIGGINACITGLLAEYGSRPVILTGGLGGYLSADGRFHDPHFGLRGAAILACLMSGDNSQ